MCQTCIKSNVCATIYYIYRVTPTSCSSLQASDYDSKQQLAHKTHIYKTGCQTIQKA